MPLASRSAASAGSTRQKLRSSVGSFATSLPANPRARSPWPQPRRRSRPVRSEAWGDTTIRGHVNRGTGILNNELYVGRLVWNRLRYHQGPEHRQARVAAQSARGLDHDGSPRAAHRRGCAVAGRPLTASGAGPCVCSQTIGLRETRVKRLWRPELLKMHGREIDISVRDRTITIALARGRIRDLGLSR